MRREGRVSGKPTNHTRVTGKCRVVGCPSCHDSLPLNKSKGKGKGRVKRLLSDIPSTHLLSDWRVNKPSLPNFRPKGSRKIVQPALNPATDWAPDDDDVEVNGYDDDSKEPEGWALSISLLLDTALKHIHESVGARNALQKTEVETDNQEHEGLDAPHAEDTDDEITVPDFETFKKEFEVFKRETAAGHSPASVVESADSWSGIELSDIEADDSSLGDWKDDWSIVDEIAV